MNGISLGYIGVHQIFQLALAAQEIDALDGLFVSMLGTSGWGKWIGKFRRAKSLAPLGYEGLPSEKIWQYPWPILSRSLPRWPKPQDAFASNCWFDKKMASWLSKMNSKVFVGEETCSEYTFLAAQKMGTICVLDCAGVPSTQLDQEAQIAAEYFGLKISASSNSLEMTARKNAELSLANLVICCSEYQSSELCKAHPNIGRVEVCSLWADTEFWGAAAAQRTFSGPNSPLRVLYAGAISLRKGIPYLLEAIQQLSETEIELTLVGNMSSEIDTRLLSKFRKHTMHPAVNRLSLRRIFAQHDLLVMPTLGDSFGFIVLEAMASGLPVIVSENTGAPVPDATWRVPVHDASSISAKLYEYIKNKQLLHIHSQKALNFAQCYTPERYRKQISSIFQSTCGAV